MLKAIVSIAIGDKFQELSKLTFPRFKAYAERVGADFIAITSPKISVTSPHWEKFQLFELLNRYDRIIYIDVDVLIRLDSDDLFSVVPVDSIGLFNEAPFTEGREYALMRGAEEYQAKNFVWSGRYYNSGVMVISKEHQYLFKKPEREIFNFFEQTYLNLAIQLGGVKVHDLHYKFNRMSCLDPTAGEPRHASMFVHYAGLGADLALRVAQKDVEILDSTPKDKVWPKLIWVSVEGGLGDQVQAEPTLRFLSEKLHPNDDIRVTTHYPELFSHLKVKVAKHEELIWNDTDTYPFKRITMPNPKTPLWSFLSNMLCHTVDFVSIAVLKRILTNEWRKYTLTYPIEAKKRVKMLSGLKDFSKSALIHLGSGWKNKTFPKEFFQEIIDGLVEKGITPILIGKDCEKFKVIEVQVPEKAIDLRNLLSLHDLIALIDLCPLLITNDSAPLHIAGAFSNHIILIPTCKHPDHLLPWRNGSIYWKAKALYKKLIYDEIKSSPACVYTVLGDDMLGPWSDYLPDSETVVLEAIKMLAISEE